MPNGVDKTPAKKHNGAVLYFPIYHNRYYDYLSNY